MRARGHAGFLFGALVLALLLGLAAAPAARATLAEGSAHATASGSADERDVVGGLARSVAPARTLSISTSKFIEHPVIPAVGAVLVFSLFGCALATQRLSRSYGTWWMARFCVRRFGPPPAPTPALV